ncbi:HAD hydrolase-like protein [Nonomuraea sp. NPDC055795]
MVGDNPVAGIEGGKAVGLRTILVGMSRHTMS